MALFKKTTLALCTVALVAAVGCGSNNEDNNAANNANNANNENNANNTSNTPNNTTSNTPNNTTSNTPNNTTSNTPNNTSNNPPNNTPGGATFCALECMDAADCAADPTDWECNANRCEFTGEVDGCTDDAECTATFSGWVTECQDDAGCPGQVCIDIGDANAGRCATEAGGVVACDTLMQSDFDTTKFEDASAVMVCANTAAECGDQGFCRVPCVDDTTCGDLVCDTDSGNCVCEDDSHCTVDGFDTCYDGVCGCAEEASCDGLEGATGNMYTCEAP